MSIMDYLALSYEHQWDVFHDKSVFITSVETIDAFYELYVIDTFFVEIISDPTLRIRQAVTPFVEGERLEKYAEDAFTQQLIALLK